jgi:hypothetical protein
MQYLPLLTSLRALHFIGFHPDYDHNLHGHSHDMNYGRPPIEFIQWIADIVANHPEMPLRYVAADSVVQTFFRAPKSSDATANATADVNAKDKGKAKAEAPAQEAASGSNNNSFNTKVSVQGGGPSYGPELLTLAMLMGSHNIIHMPVDGSGASLWNEQEADSTDDEDGMATLGDRIVLNAPQRLGDIFGVRIFAKDVVGGWL